MEKKTISKKKPAKKNTPRSKSATNKTKSTSTRSRRSSKKKVEKVVDKPEVKVKKAPVRKTETKKKPVARSRKRNSQESPSKTAPTSKPNNRKNTKIATTPKKIEVPKEEIKRIQTKNNHHNNTNTSSPNKTTQLSSTNQKSSNNDFSVTINQNVAVLVDGNNIEKSIHSLLNTKNAMLDFDNIIPKLLRNRGLNRLIYFREGLHISSKLAERLHKKYFGTVVPCHKSADIPLSITATQLADKVDTIIILSGDSDYVDLVRHLRSRGVRVEIAAIKQTTAKILIDEADFFTEITKTDCYVR